MKPASAYPREFVGSAEPCAHAGEGSRYRDNASSEGRAGSFILRVQLPSPKSEVLLLNDAAVPGAPETSVDAGQDAWLVGFHEGRRDAMEDCYREHFGTVDAAVSRVLQGADRETVVQDVFARLVSDSKLRLAFKGGRLTAWLGTLSHNLAIDFARHRRFEQPGGLCPVGDRVHSPHAIERQAEVRLLVERFREERLPPHWAPVF